MFSLHLGNNHGLEDDIVCFLRNLVPAAERTMTGGIMRHGPPFDGRYRSRDQVGLEIQNPTNT